VIEYLITLTLTYSDATTRTFGMRVPETNRAKALQEARRLVTSAETRQKYSGLRAGLTSWDVDVKAEEPIP